MNAEQLRLITGGPSVSTGSNRKERWFSRPLRILLAGVALALFLKVSGFDVDWRLGESIGRGFTTLVTDTDVKIERRSDAPADTTVTP